MKNSLSVIGSILLGSAKLALAAFAVLVLIGLWERHGHQATALVFSGIYERYLAAEIATMPQASTTAEAAAFEE